ncbi:MAG: diguanylate cyclase [Magnetococcus sp. YQC-5]
MVVDDDPHLREFIITHLNFVGFKTLDASDGQHALELLASSDPPDVIILDWMMPRLEGPEVARRIRASGNHECYIIMLTVRNSPNDHIIGLRTESVDLYTDKPFDINVLLAQVEVGTRQAQQRRDASAYKKHAFIDQLTSLGNRRAFDEALKREMAQARRGNHPLALIIFDLDHFKHVNDTYGHHVGDQVLSSIGTLTQQTLRQSDLGFRYGGEEFVILLPETDAQGGVILAEKLRKRVEEFSFPVVGHKTASFGLAELLDADTVTTLMERADASLYQSKHQGRNRVTVAS